MAEPLTREEIEKLPAYLYEWTQQDVFAVRDTALHYEARLREVAAQLQLIRAQQKEDFARAEKAEARVAELEAAEWERRQAAIEAMENE